jgi:hypothetical protein
MMDTTAYQEPLRLVDFEYFSFNFILWENYTTLIWSKEKINKKTKTIINIQAKGIYKERYLKSSNNSSSKAHDNNQVKFDPGTNFFFCLSVWNNKEEVVMEESCGRNNRCMCFRCTTIIILSPNMLIRIIGRKFGDKVVILALLLFY